MRHDWEGDIHTLTVYSVIPPETDDLFDDGELDFDIEHPPSCKCTEEDLGNGIPAVSWDCEVQTSGVDDGLASSLRYSGTPVTEPGVYRIRGWGATHWTECGDEYDGGVVITDGAALPVGAACLRVEVRMIVIRSRDHPLVLAVQGGQEDAP